MNPLKKISVPLARAMATLRMSAREQSYFGLGYLLFGYALRVIRVFVILMLWRALLTAGVDSEGFTLAQLLTYTLVSAILADALNVRTPASDWFYDGSILTPFLRPMGIFGQLAVQTMGRWVFPMLLCSLPMLLIAPLMGISMLPATAWVVPSFVLSVSLGFAMDFLFACYVIRLKDAGWVMQWLRQAITLLLSGAFIPLAVLPWGLGEVFRFLPPASMAGAPLSLYVGLASPMQVIPLQVLWNLLLWPMALWGFGRSRERMVSYGG